MSSILHSEIFEQPVAIRRLLDAESGHVAEIARRLSQQDIRFILIAARGTSDNAARYGQYLFGSRNRLQVALATPSLFSIYRTPPRLQGGLVIAISQSGQSPDIVSVLEEARAQHVPTIAITNDPRSPLALSAENCIELHADEERSIAATKTYTAQLAALALLSLHMAGESIRRGRLMSIPGWIEQALGSEPAARSAAESLDSMEHCAVLGRGFNYATTFEIALKIKELACVEAEPYSGADFEHGPIALATSGYPVIIVAAGAAVRPELDRLGHTLRERGARLAIIGDNETLRHAGDLWIPLPGGLPEWLAPLAAVVPGQLLAFHLARARGLDPDHPRLIQKITLTC